MDSYNETAVNPKIIVEKMLWELLDEESEQILYFKKKLVNTNFVVVFIMMCLYSYGRMKVDSGKAIVFAYPQGVKSDGPIELSSGRNPLLEKRKNKYRMRDFSGVDEKSLLSKLMRKKSIMSENVMFKKKWKIG